MEINLHAFYITALLKLAFEYSQGKIITAKYAKISILNSDHAIIASEIMSRRSKNIHKIYLITTNPHMLCQM